MSEFSIQLEPRLTVDEFIDVLRRSRLAERRPVDDRTKLEGMLKHASVLATARLEDGRLVGIARAITDFSYCTYLSDLAVDESFQRQGIGKKLIDFTHQEAGCETTMILLSAPAAVEYYPHIGMKKHDSCWTKP